MRKGFFAAILAAALVAGACGGSDETNPTRFGAIEDPGNLCETVPITVPGISILGHYVQSVSDVSVCVEADVKVSGTPTVVNQPDCGDPCFSIEVKNLEVSEDVGIKVSYKRAGKPQDPIVYDPDPYGIEQGTIDKCVIGVGEPDPCTARITQPKQLTGSSSKFKVNLSWMQSTHTGDAKVAGYEVWRTESGTENAFEMIGTAASTSFTDTAVTVGTTYTYYVLAFDGEGLTSEASDVAEVKASKKKVAGGNTGANDSKKKNKKK